MSCFRWFQIATERGATGMPRARPRTAARQASSSVGRSSSCLRLPPPREAAGFPR